MNYTSLKKTNQNTVVQTTIQLNPLLNLVAPWLNIHVGLKIKYMTRVAVGSAKVERCLFDLVV